MKWIFCGIICLLLSACSSSNDEPTEYTGPWEIAYSEYYYGVHTDNEDFITWFNNHTSHFEAAFFRSADNSVEFILLASYDNVVELYDYENWYSGDIHWYEIVEHATEAEIKEKVSEFEAFTIPEQVNRTYDKFSAYYQKLKD